MASSMKKRVCVGLMAGALALVAGCRNYNPAEVRHGWEMLGQAAGNPSGGVGTSPPTGGASFRYPVTPSLPSPAPGAPQVGAGTFRGTGGSGR